MARLQAVAQACEAQGLFETAAPGDALLFTAGGSAIYDLVAPGLRVALNRRPWACCAQAATSRMTTATIAATPAP